MSYHVLARKWRPQTFSDLVGQQHVVKALTYALNNQKIHHAYLFTGTRGVGKTSIARIFAKSLNCETKGISANPCCTCQTCTEITNGKYVDLIEVDAASRTGVDETRELIESVAYLPSKGRYKVYLIDEVHMFSKSSFNALLKTLEEPPEHVKFILATTDPDKLPITILSRCIQFNLKALTPIQIRQHLANICHSESIPYDEQALAMIAQAGDGSMRDTLSITDQAIAYGSGQLRVSAVTDILGTIQPQDIEAILFAIATNNPHQLKQALHRLDDYEVDARSFLIEIMRRLQQMAWAKEGIIETLSPALQSTVTDIPKELLHLWYDIAEKALPSLSLAGDPRQSVEMALLRMLAFIPTDWITRHRTLLETSESNNNDTDCSTSSYSLDDAESPSSPRATEEQTTAPENNTEHVDFAQHVQATPVHHHDSLDLAEQSFSEQHSISPPTEERCPTNDEPVIQTPVNHTPQTSDIDSVAPATPEAHNTDNQQPWHLSTETNHEPSPSMEDVMKVMKSGRAIQSPQNVPQPEPTDAPILETTPPWEEHHGETHSAPPQQSDARAHHPTDTPVSHNVNDSDPQSSSSTPQEQTYQAPIDRAVIDTAPQESFDTAPSVEVSNINNHISTETSEHEPRVGALTDMSADINRFDWYATLPALQLSEYTHHFASLGILHLSQIDNYIQARFDLPPKHELLITEDSLTELSQALENRFNAPINLETNITALDMATPGEREKIASDQRQADLIDAFRQEPITQEILQTFEAQIIEKTVSAVKTQQEQQESAKLDT